MRIDKEFIKDRLEATTGLDISDNTRKREYINLRAVYYKLCKEYTIDSLSKIGGLVGRDHATVLHGLKTFDTLNVYEPKIYAFYTQFKNKYPIESIGLMDDEDLEKHHLLIDEIKHLHKRIIADELKLELMQAKYDDMKAEKHKTSQGKFYMAIEELTDEQKDIAYERFLAMVSMIKSVKVH